MIILRSPKGWPGPVEVDGVKIEGKYRAYQVPMSCPAQHPSHLENLDRWLRSYEPETLFDTEGALLPELKNLIPPKDKRMGT